MKRKQLIALLLVAIMAVATLPVIAAAEQQAAPAQTPAVGAYRTPTLTETHTPTYPKRGETYTVSGRLSWGGVGLANRPLIVWVMWPRPGVWQWTNYPYSVSTDANGYYRISSASLNAREVWWKVRFAGDSVYYAKNAYNQVYIGLSHISILYVEHISGSISNTLTVHGRVTDGYGNPIRGAPVMIESRVGSSGSWFNTFYEPVVYTDSNGYYSNSKPDSGLIVDYQAEFMGYGTSLGVGPNSYYWYSESPIVTS